MTDVDKSVDKVYSLFLPLSRSSDTMQNERECHADDKGPDMNAKKAPVRTGKKAPVRTGRPAPAAPAPAAPTTKTGKAKKANSANFANETIWSGNNIDILRGMNSECVDLIYLDPPFNSNKNYEAPIGSEAAGAAFKDAWTLDDIDICEHGELADRNPAAYSVIEAARLAHGKSMQSYLIFMAVRLLEMQRILKPTGSIYLHCDPTASHFLKLLMDGIFGRENFKNEIVWKRFNFHADAKRFGTITDRILFYARSEDYFFDRVRTPYSEDYIKSKFTHKEDDGRVYRLDNLNPPGGRGPVYEFNGVTKAWRTTKDKMEQLEKEGRIYTKSKVPQLKRYLDEMPGQAAPDLWLDISPINSQAKERTGYPTQKPLSLLERIIEASSKRGDMVLDPFCGCATTLVAADRLQREWTGIDLSPLAIELVNKRIKADRGIFGGATALKEPPRRTDLGKLPNYRTHRHELYGKQEGVCAGCDTHFPFRVMEVDHMLPRSKGGTDHIENLQILCSGCNRSKGGRTMAEWKADR